MCSTIFLFLIIKNKHIHLKPNGTQNCILYKKFVINELIYMQQKVVSEKYLRLTLGKFG